MPQIRVQLFAQFRELRGTSELQVDVLDGATAAETFAALFGDTPLAKLPVGFAVNATYVEPGHVLRGGDDLVFIPPIGGG